MAAIASNGAERINLVAQHALETYTSLSGRRAIAAGRAERLTYRFPDPRLIRVAMCREQSGRLERRWRSGNSSVIAIHWLFGISPASARRNHSTPEADA